MSRPAEREPEAGGLQRLIVTRPAAEAGAWVDALQAQGWPAVALPLIHITEPRDAAIAQALHQARAHWAEMDALMFVSGAAVSHFFARDVAPLQPAKTPRTRFWAPGPGTARVLAQALAGLGLDASRIDVPPADAPQFDSEALWPVVAPQVLAGRRILVVRGVSVDAVVGQPSPPAGNGRDWLIRQCTAAGARVQACVAYERCAPDWTAHTQAQAQQAQAAGSVWLFSSSEALDHLLAADPQADWSQAAALVTHPRIAERARQAGFGRVVQTRPALPDVLRALESGWTRP